MRLTQSISDEYQATKPKKTLMALLDYSKTCLSEQLKKASRLHTHSGCAIYPTEKPKCRSTETEADSYHYARGSLKDPSCRRFPSCCTSLTFGESYPKTWSWPCLTTRSLKQPFRKP